MKENLKENIVHIIKVITGQEYKELKGEWEQQNITIDKLTLERNKEAKKVEKLKKEKLELEGSYEEEKQILLEDIDDLRNGLQVAMVKIKKLEKDLKDQKAKHEKALKEKENQRKQLACRIGGYVTENNKLKDQVNFLKTCKRAPSLDELKDYTLRRKSVSNK